MELHQPIQEIAQEYETNQTRMILSDIRSRAQNLRWASRAISDAEIKQKGSNDMGFGSQSILVKMLLSLQLSCYNRQDGGVMAIKV